MRGDDGFVGDDGSPFRKAEVHEAIVMRRDWMVVVTGSAVVVMAVVVVVAAAVAVVVDVSYNLCNGRRGSCCTLAEDCTLVRMRMVQVAGRCVGIGYQGSVVVLSEVLGNGEQALGHHQLILPYARAWPPESL